MTSEEKTVAAVKPRATVMRARGSLLAGLAAELSCKAAYLFKPQRNEAMNVSNADIVRGIIDTQNAKLVRWYSEGKIDSVAAVFAADAWQMAPNAPPLIGRDAIRTFWSQAVQWGKWELSLDAQQVDVSGPMAVERGKYRLRFTAGPAAPSGMNSFEDWGNYLVHWRREADDEWRIAGDAPVSERPLQTAATP